MFLRGFTWFIVNGPCISTNSQSGFLFLGTGGGHGGTGGTITIVCGGGWMLCCCAGIMTTGRTRGGVIGVLFTGNSGSGIYGLDGGGAGSCTIRLGSGLTGGGFTIIGGGCGTGLSIGRGPGGCIRIG
jgi:hypothetical protein